MSFLVSGNLLLGHLVPNKHKLVIMCKLTVYGGSFYLYQTTIKCMRNLQCKQMFGQFEKNGVLDLAEVKRMQRAWKIKT